MKWLKKKLYIVGLLTIATLVLTYYGFSLQDSGAQYVVTSQAQSVPTTPTKLGIINKTNTYRASKGLESLSESKLLDESACLKANDMVTKKYWSHVSPDGTQPWYWFVQAGYKYSIAGENLENGYANDSSVVSAWIKSPTHEANLSGKYTEVGVCVVNGFNVQGVSNTLVVAHYASPR